MTSRAGESPDIHRAAPSYGVPESGHGELRGLSPQERLMTTAEFFAQFCWKPQRLDPKRLSARDFLARL